MNTIVKQHAKDIDNLKMLARLHQRITGTIRDDLNQAKLEITQSLGLQDLRLSEVENGYTSVNDWAGDVAGKIDPDEIWDNLSGKEARLSELEMGIEEVISSGGLGACARPSDADDESLKEKVEKLEE